MSIEWSRKVAPLALYFTLVVEAIDFTIVNDGSSFATRGFEGCFYARNADPAYSGSYSTRTDTEADGVDSPERCRSHCSGQGYSYFGLVCPTELSVTCLCADDLPITELDASECSGGSLTAATGCGASQGACTGVTASGLYAYEGYYIGGCEREAVYRTEQRAIATCTMSTPGSVHQVLVDGVDISEYLLGSPGAYTIAFDGMSQELAVHADGEACSGTGISVTCACTQCVEATCADCGWDGLDIETDTLLWKGHSTNTVLEGAWYLPDFDDSRWYFPEAATGSGMCFSDGDGEHDHWFIVGGPAHTCDFVQCKTCQAQDTTNPKNPTCYLQHPSDVDITMDPQVSTSLSETKAGQTCAEGSDGGEIICGVISDGVLSEAACSDPAVDFSCDVTLCDFYDLAGNCYRYIDIVTTWTEAESTCQRRGGHVAYATDDRVIQDMVDHMNSLQTPAARVWLGVYSSSECEFQPADGSITYGDENWRVGDPSDCLSSGGGCGTNWDVTTDGDCCVALESDAEWDSRGCTEEFPYFCVTSATSTNADVVYVGRGITCDSAATTCGADTFSATGTFVGTDCLGSCDDACQVSGGCEYDAGCDDCDVCDEAACDDPSCDEDGCDGAGCDDPSCDEASCDGASCDADGCDTKGCDQPSCDNESCDYASCDVQSCDDKGCDAAGCDTNSCDEASCDGQGCDGAGCDVASCDDPACDEASCDAGGCDLGGCDTRACDDGGCDRQQCNYDSCDDKSCDFDGCDSGGCDNSSCDLGGCDADGCDGDGCDAEGCDDDSCDLDCDADCGLDNNLCDSGETCDGVSLDGSCDFDEACDGFFEDCDYDDLCDKSSCTNGVSCDGDEECDSDPLVCQVDGTGCDGDEDCDNDEECDSATCSNQGGEACDNGNGDCTSNPSVCDGDEGCDAALCEDTLSCDGDESCDDDESCDADACAVDSVAGTGGACDGDEACSFVLDCDQSTCEGGGACDLDEGCDDTGCENGAFCDGDESCDATSCSGTEALCDGDESCDGFVGLCSAGGLSGNAACDGDEECDDDGGCDNDEACDQFSCTFTIGHLPADSTYNPSTCDQDEGCDFDESCDNDACTTSGTCDGDEECDQSSCEAGTYCDTSEGCDLDSCTLNAATCDGDEQCDGWVNGLCQTADSCDDDESCDAGFFTGSQCDVYPNPICDGDESCDLTPCENAFTLAGGLTAACDGDEQCDTDDECDRSTCESGGACDSDEECDQTTCEGHGLSEKEWADAYNGDMTGFSGTAATYCDGDELCNDDEDCDNTACSASIDMSACDLTSCNFGNFCDDDEACDFDEGCDNNGGCDYDVDCDFDESCDYDDNCDNDQSCDFSEGCDDDGDGLGSCDRNCDDETCDEIECDLCSGDCQTCGGCQPCAEDCPFGQFREGCGFATEGSCVPCKSIADGYFFNSNGRLRDQCHTVECSKTCPIGQYNDDCEFTASDNGNCVDCTPTPGYYFVDDGDLTDSCTAELCNLDCPRGEYLLGCEATNNGSCTACTRIPDGFFFTTGGRLLDNCEHHACFEDCPVGEYNMGCVGTSPGVCTDCTAPPAGDYFTSNGGLEDACGTETCAVTTTCPVGQWNYGCDQTTSSGTCLPCTTAPEGHYYTSNADVTDSCSTAECTLACPLGQYNAGCSGGTDPSICAECDKPPDGFYFTSGGDYRSDSCTSAACVLDCPTGQYKGGCDGKPAIVVNGAEVGGQCANCSLPPIGYYFTGAGDYFDNCPSEPCAGCDTGFYRQGCDGTTATGSCVSCTVPTGFYAVSAGTNDNATSCLLAECFDDCGIGRYKTGCTFVDRGVCTNCTKLPDGFYFTSNGNFADSCEFKHGNVEDDETLGNVFSGAGDLNAAFGSLTSVIAVGTSNTLDSMGSSVIAGGTQNTLNGAWATIVGGKDNEVLSKASYATIGSGRENTVTAKYGTVGAGRLNGVYSNYGTVLGGYANRVSGKFATVIGGSRNTASGLRSVALGFKSHPKAVNSMVWGFDETVDSCVVATSDPNTLQVCTQSFLVNGQDFLEMLDSHATDQSTTCADSPGDGTTEYCQSTGLPVGTECVVNLASCAGSGRADVVCEAGDATSIGSGATWSDPVCLVCPPDGCFGESCAYYMPGGAGGGSYSCETLENNYGCDCAACSCARRELSEEKHSGKLENGAITTPCREGSNCSRVVAHNGALAKELEMKIRLWELKDLYQQELVRQNEQLATVNKLLATVEQLSKRTQRDQLQGHQQVEFRSRLRANGKFAQRPHPGSDWAPAPSVPQPTPNPNQGLESTQNARRRTLASSGAIASVLSRRRLSTRQDQLPTQAAEVATLAGAIDTLRNSVATLKRLPGDEASPSGACSDPQIVYDGTNLYVCDGSVWSTLTTF